MITNFFIPDLNNHDVQELWFQQDGATCHTARATIDLLKDTFGDRLISRFGPENWPPRSCDITPLDYFLWGYVKSLVYADKPQTLDDLEDNIRRVIADIRPQMLEKVIENRTSRLDYLRASRGSPMPEIIFKIKDYEEEFVRAQLSVILEERFEGDEDIVLFLTLFERQAKRIGVVKTNWVSALLARMLSDITQLIARELEDKFDYYDYIKGVLLKRFKMSRETFRQKFMKHQRIPARSWRDFVFEITSYFEEWLDGMEIKGVETNERFQEQSSATLTAKVAIPICSPTREDEKIDELKFVRIKCGNEILKAVIDTGTQISMVRADVVEGKSVDSGGIIQIMSAFGEREVTELKIFNLKIGDSRHGVVLIMCAVSKRLVNDMLVCSSAYEALLENARAVYSHNPANSYVSSRAVECITADDPKSISSQEMTRETYPSEIYIPSLSKANEEEQLPEGRETRSSFIKMQREDDTLKKLWRLAEKQKNSVKIYNAILTHSEYICGENIDQVVLPQCKREEVYSKWCMTSL
ncbi:retrovirus-related Pol polyprotein from transposon opus [Trichonephila clavipes]|uniref:Retrovirus-related Pol polyprotein from transposon opus n=1 Tax=Trichonephila clavipes TaxID=2585209 RepID=A0A8X6RW20_TRICX|nr:retrovirus-related Pol polyprotein from transposon opus [Trichonephila clavipes]